MSYDIVHSSFRDPSGFLFTRDGILYRQVNKSYKANYDLLISSGLYDALVQKNLLIHHEEVNPQWPKELSAYKIIRPKYLDFISYPYEWCFSQLKDAALTTLVIQKEALSRGMSLKDASAYNIQFESGHPVFIDTLSFKEYQEGEPWAAYRQFCQHFLAPLSLMSYTDIRLSKLLRIYIDGIPLDLASRLLPIKTRFQLTPFAHIHLHAYYQNKFAGAQIKKQNRSISKQELLALIDNLSSFIKKLHSPKLRTEWGEYYEDTNYSNRAFSHKQEVVDKLLKEIQPKTVWDFGANTGVFSRIASQNKANTIAFDIDPVAVEKNYLKCKSENNPRLLPLVLDLTNPSPGLGWGNQGRYSILQRGPVDAVMALALIHHLAISNNLPFRKIASFLSKVGKSLIIEFIPKNDSNLQRLLVSRKDIFANYTQTDFESEFSKYFLIVSATPVNDSGRIIYLMKTK